MRLYDPEKDELLLLYWWLELRRDPVEFENLFCQPLRSLTSIMAWAQNAVRVMIDVDDEGIRFAAWITPFLSGVELGAWARKSHRGTKGHLKFMDEVYAVALSQFPVLIGWTKQEKLHRLHLRMGYVYVGTVPSLFDGSPVREYYMTQETRDGRFKQQDIDRNAKLALRGPSGEVQQGVSTSGTDVRSTGNGSPENGRRKRTDTSHPKRRGRKPRSGIDQQRSDAGIVGESGAG